MTQKMNAKRGVLAGGLSLLTVCTILVLAAPGWYDTLPQYKEWIVGLTTWSGYNKQADMQVIKTILLGLPVLFLFYAAFLDLWERKLGEGDAPAKIFGGTYVGVLLMLLTQKDAKWEYFFLWLVLFVGYIISCWGQTKERQKNELWARYQTSLLYALYLFLTQITLVLLANTVKASTAELWEKLGVLPAAVSAVFFLVLCTRNRTHACSDKPALLQLVLPFACLGFVHFRYFYEPQNAVMELFYSGRWKWFCVLLTLLLLAAALWQMRRKKQGIWASTFVMTALLRVFVQPQGLLSVDYFHNGEILMPMQQLVTYHKLPYLDLIPIHGLCDYYYGSINAFLFDGTYLSVNAAKLVGNLLMAALLALVIYFFVEKPVQGLALVYFGMPFMIESAGMRYWFMFTLFFVLFSPKLRSGMAYLYSWTLLSILAIAWNASIGGAAALAFLPVVLYRLIRWFPKEWRQLCQSSKKQKIAQGALWGALVVGGVLFLPLFWQIVLYLKDNAGTTLYVNGMEMLADTSKVASYFFPSLVNAQDSFFAVAFGFLLPVLCCAYYSIKKEEKPNYARGYFTVLILCFYVLMNYTFVRYDEGLRAAVLGVFFSLLLVVTLLSERLCSDERSAHTLFLYMGVAVFALWLMGDRPLITQTSLSLQEEIPASIETSIMGQEIADPVVYVSGASISIPKLGTGFVQGNALNSLQNVQKVLREGLSEGQTYLDLTNAVAYYTIFDTPSILPYTSAYNISNAAMQRKAIALLEELQPDMILLAPGITFDDAPLSLRSPFLYQYLMEQAYQAYKYQNVIYLLKEENTVTDAEQDTLAFAQLMHKTNLGLLPTVWENSLEEMQKSHSLQKEDISYEVVEAEDGFTIVFDTPIKGSRVDLIRLCGLDEEGQWESGEETISLELSEEAKFDFSRSGGNYILPVFSSPYFGQSEAISSMRVLCDRNAGENVERRALEVEFYTFP